MKELLLEFLNNPVVWGIALTLAMALAGWIVKKTKTKKDDQIFSLIVHAFDIAEHLNPDDLKGRPSWAVKGDKALKVFKENYIDRYGTAPPEDLKQVAKDQWSLLANEAKKK